MQDRVERIKHMETCMQRVEAAVQNGDLASVQKEIRTLQAYMDSGRWLQDYEADERGEIPRDLKRGVLSQDGLYDLLCSLKTE